MPDPTYLTPKGYTDIPAIEDYLLIDIAEYFEPRVSEWIANVEKFIDQVTGRHSFIADTEAVARYYDGNAKRELITDDFVEITEVKLGTDDDADTFDDEDERTEYLLYPNNAGIEKRPYNSIKLISQIFPSGDQNIKITARWGYSEEVPSDIKLVATKLVSEIIEESMSAEGEVQSMSVGRYSVTYQTQERWLQLPFVKDMIQTYKAYKF